MYVLGDIKLVKILTIHIRVLSITQMNWITIRIFNFTHNKDFAILHKTLE